MGKPKKKSSKKKDGTGEGAAAKVKEELGSTEKTEDSPSEITTSTASRKGRQSKLNESVKNVLEEESKLEPNPPRKATGRAKKAARKAIAGKKSEESEPLAGVDDGSKIDDGRSKADESLGKSVSRKPRSTKKGTPAAKSKTSEVPEETNPVLQVEDNLSNSDTFIDETPKSKQSATKAKRVAKAKQDNAKTPLTSQAAVSDDAVFVTPKSKAKKTKQGSARSTNKNTPKSGRKTPKLKKSIKKTATPR